jgi:hypothetical protein
MAERTKASGTPVIRFEAQVQSTGGSAILRLPDDASAQLPSRGQVAVKGVMNGYAFQTVLEPDGRRGHWLKVDKKLRQALAVSEGDTVALKVGITSRPTFDPAPVGLACWSPMGRWPRFLSRQHPAATRAHRAGAGALYAA